MKGFLGVVLFEEKPCSGTDWKTLKMMIQVRLAIVQYWDPAGVLSRRSRAGPTREVPSQASEYYFSRVTSTLKRSRRGFASRRTVWDRKSTPFTPH